MRGVDRLRVAARSWFRPSHVDREFTEEVQFHIEHQAEEYRRTGLPADEALRRARLEVGHVGAMREESRDGRAGEPLRQLWRDISFGWRMLRRSPGYTFSAILVLALGIGATTAIFSLVDAALLRPLPFPQPDRLVKVFQRSPRSVRSLVTLGDVRDWVEQNRSFQAIAGVAAGGPASLGVRSDGSSEIVATQNVTPQFFDVLQVAPLLGRTFRRDEPDDARVVIVSERLWRNHFGADPTIIGREIRLGGGLPLTVVGVVRADFALLGHADLWTLPPATLGGRGEQGRRVHFLDVIARLEPDRSIDQARADLATLAQNAAVAWPTTNNDWGVTIEPLQRALVSDDLRRTALVLMAGVTFILIMACGNVANLMLAKGLGRSSELALRSALGGTRSRVIRQLLTESFVLTSIGGAAGFGLASIGLWIAPTVIPPATLPPSVVLTMDWRLTSFALAATFVAAFTSGFVPAWQATRTVLLDVIGSGNRATVGRGGRLRATLAVLQVAAAVLLTTGAGLFVRTIVALNNVDAGYRAEHVLSMAIGLPFQRYAPTAQTLRFYETVREQIAALPGVRVASILSGDLPLDGFSRGMPFEVSGEPAIDPSHQPLAQFDLISPEYFDALGIAITRGRAFTADDTGTSPPVCIVSEAFARRFLQTRDPLTSSLTIRSLVLRLPDSVPVTRQIVGVVRQVRVRPGERESMPQIYVPFAQNPWIQGKIVVRTVAEPVTLVAPIKAVVTRFDRDLTVTDVKTMEDVAASATASPRFRAWLLSVFAGLAMSIAGVGLFSILSFMVRQRSREFSVRLALGARPTDLIRLVASQGARLGVAGLTIGFVTALVLVRTLSALLFGVEPIDPATFVVASAVLGSLTLVASAAPAWLAARSDPTATLRQE